MRRRMEWKVLLRSMGIVLMAEGVLMALCMVPAWHFADGTLGAVGICSAFTLAVGALLWLLCRRHTVAEDRRMSYLTVVAMWVVLPLFATLPFLATGATGSFTVAWFEAMSGVTSTGATVFADVAALPSSVLLWRSMTQWFGGFGVVLLVLALSPRLGINKYALYTAETSGADNSGRRAVRTTVTVRRTLGVYLALTAAFIVALWVSGMQMWDAVNLTFTNISSGGFSVNSDSIASLTPLQQYILTGAMLLSGVNFSLLYLLFTLRWRQIGHKVDQLRFYLVLCLLAVAFVVGVLHWQGGYGWEEALRLGTVQTVSALTTTGSVAADTTQWWTPAVFLLLMLSVCGGMAGSTSGGMKVMRVLILLRNARSIMRNRLHPRVVNPVRLNGSPVSNHITNNVMVIFMVYGFTLMAGVMVLMLCGIDATESIGATVGCLTGYGPGLGASGGFGSYAAFTPAAMWFCSFLMLLGRLECMTVLVLFLPGFWRR
ncbi:MAG: TrkH family potassium uptake protein [Bacteroidales bacterium]|nr:TrkH family potassium uptake protein [Bacteroidales bacterium]